MRRGLLLWTAALLLPVAAVWAQERVPAPVNSLGLGTPSAPSGQLPGAEGPGYEEDFETFIVGQQVAGQNGWRSDFGLNTQVVQPGIVNISARHAMDGTFITGFEMNSASFPPQMALATDVLLTGTTGLYQLIPDSPSGFFITRLNFETDGSITVGQGDPACTMFVFEPSLGFWSPGFVTRIGFEVPGDGSLTVYQDGFPIFTGQDLNDQCFAGPEGINELLTFADNVGTGSFDGAGDTLTLDNISSLIDIAVPGVPAADIPVLDWRGLAVLMMVLAALAVWMIRRRRAELRAGP